MPWSIRLQRSSRSLLLIDAKESIPPGNDYDGARKFLKRRIMKSLKEDRELWYTSKAQELEKAFATGNSHGMFQLIRLIGYRKDD
ncbi:ATP-binding cassette transporter [Clonorchis sinensis]|uniref:ATP-binding cassette transporter n=1 Tax=Clonorchis sinensis TaxID=79923 RepID=H2KPC0_CLOSI|nr:ATP-binding cassette transporter [Clonorchis sinensis]